MTLVLHLSCHVEEYGDDAGVHLALPSADPDPGTTAATWATNANPGGCGPPEFTILPSGSGVYRNSLLFPGPHA